MQQTNDTLNKKKRISPLAEKLICVLIFALALGAFIPSAVCYADRIVRENAKSDAQLMMDTAQAYINRAIEQDKFPLSTDPTRAAQEYMNTLTKNVAIYATLQDDYFTCTFRLSDGKITAFSYCTGKKTVTLQPDGTWVADQAVLTASCFTCVN